MKSTYSQFLITLSLATLGCLTLPNTAKAQIAPDGTLSTQVSSPDNLNFTINQGDRAGVNLFHSFREFSVPTNGSAVFQNSLDVQNIINRVTGGSISSIDGLIQANGSANFFLINPAGIVFGPNASLNIGGSFFSSTADSLIFEDGVEFSASNTQTPPLLTVNIPSGLRFRDNPKAIDVQGYGQNFGLSGTAFPFENPTLEVFQGRNLALIGGNVNLDGGILQAEGGLIEVGGLAGAGTIQINNDGSLTYPNAVARADVTFANQAGINVITDRFGGGSININAHNINITGDSLLTAGIMPSLNEVNTTAGDITLNATGETRIDGSRIENNVNYETLANSRNINIQTNSFVLINGAELNASNFGSSDESVFAGDIRVDANEKFSLDGNARIISNGFAGRIFITSKNHSININNSLISTESNDDNTNTELFSSIDISAPQGSILINSSQLNTTNSGTGFAGDITLNARDLISINSPNSPSSNPGDRTIQSRGKFGRILIGNENSAPKKVELTNVSLTATNDSVPISIPDSIDAGTVSIYALEGISLQDSFIETLTRRRGNAGNVTIQAENADITLTNGSSVFSNVEAGGIGDAGTINVTARNLSLTDGAQLLTLVSDGGEGNAANINIKASGEVLFSGFSNIDFSGAQGFFPSGVRTEVLSKTSGEAGYIDINASSILLRDNASVTSNNITDGFAGDITLNARDQISLTEGFISSDGFAGRIFINLDNNSINISNSSISTESNDENTNTELFSNIEISAPQGSILIKNSGINTTNFGTGLAGDVTLNARDTIALNEGFISSDGFAGRISINSENNSVNISNSSISTESNDENTNTELFSKIDVSASQGSIWINNSGLNTTNFGTGFAGDIILNASDQISLNQSIISSDGNSGRIFIGKNDLYKVTSSPRTVTLNSSTLSTTNSSVSMEIFPNESINAGDISIDVIDSISLEKVSNIDSSTVRTGDGGNIDIRARTLTLTNGSELLAQTREDGNNAGNIRVNATDSVIISGVASFPILMDSSPGGFSSGLFTTTEGEANGQGGEINVTTSKLEITDGGVLSARSRSNFRGGNITVNANTLELTGGGQILTTTFRDGYAGNIDLKVSDRIIIAGSDPTYELRFNQILQAFPNGFPGVETSQNGQDVAEFTIDPVSPESGIFANTASGSTGRGGSIFIDPKQVTIRDSGTISATSLGTGEAGNITLEADNLTIDSGRITAESGGALGGNINFNIRDLLLLRRNSQISATAGRDRGAGDGGNINIKTGFLVGLPQENSDITANAFTGTGGRVNIQAEAIFGIKPLSRGDLERLLNTTNPAQLDPSRLSSSDITAISQGNPGLSGQVNIITPDVDPSKGLVELPENVTDPANQITENPCKQGEGSEFVEIGRGGLPRNPNQPLSSATVKIDLVNPVPSTSHSNRNINTLQSSKSPERRIVPAQGWIFNEKGDIVLTAYNPKEINFQRTQQTSAICSGR
jgi:filamentous hemagglutinin family protein